MSTNAMLSKATEAMQNAYAPYSQFTVGVCLKSSDGRLFNGCNVENCAYPVGSCAETSAIGSMITAGQREIVEVLIVADSHELIAPCGACRQRLYEFALPDTLVHLHNTTGKHEIVKLAELCPRPFSPQHLENP